MSSEVFMSRGENVQDICWQPIVGSEGLIQEQMCILLFIFSLFPLIPLLFSLCFVESCQEELRFFLENLQKSFFARYYLFKVWTYFQEASSIPLCIGISVSFCLLSFQEAPLNFDLSMV